MEELRKVVDLDAEILTHFPREMSGGQKQRVAIMRAMMDPAVMLLDEPMAALDPLIRRTLPARTEIDIPKAAENRAPGHTRSG